MSKKERRPQAPKRRDPVKKNMDKFHRPDVHRDKSKYDRREQRWSDMLDDYLDELGDDDLY